jgi:short-subunit dehydrogenase
MPRIWIIGASEGIGRALALELNKESGDALILSARHIERLEELSSSFCIKPLLVPIDVSNNESVLNGWNKIKIQSLEIDIVIYCAGYYKPMSAESMEIDEVEKMLDINLTGAMRVLNLVIPQLIKQKRGHIVLIGSIAGYRGLPNSIGYGSSKAGIIHLAENLKCDLSEYGIKVQVINPGFVKTRLTDLNKFRMPSIMTPEQAAISITRAMKAGCFESRFPFVFSNFLRLVSMLPYSLYFRLAKFIKPRNDK